MDLQPVHPIENGQLSQPENGPQSQRKDTRSLPWATILTSLLAEAGLVWGVWLRVLFFRSFPDPIPFPDTSNYVTAAYALLSTGQFDLYPLRTPGFPLLVWVALAFFNSFAALTVLHGVLTLLSALCVGYVVRAFGGPWHLPAALAVTFVAVHPHLLFWEHSVLTEPSFQAFFVFTVGATALAIFRPTPWRAATAGVLAAITVLIRPQGLFLVPMVLLSLAWAGRRLGRRRLMWIVVAAGVPMLVLLGGWSARNARVHGFFGLSNLSPIVYFGVSARWVDLDSPTLAEDKALIADSIRRYQSMPDHFNWVAWSPEGPGAILARKYANDPNRRDQVFTALAREAILRHPIAFIRRGLHTTYIDVTTRLSHRFYDFYDIHPWEDEWTKIAKEFPVDQYRAALNETRFPLAERAQTYNNDVRPAFDWETSFFRASLGFTLLALLSLPLLRGPRLLATALVAISAILLILTSGFFCEPNELYMVVIHGVAALAGALAITGILDLWLTRRREVKPRESSVS